MTDTTTIAAELERHIGKLGAPSGDTPSVMRAAAAELRRLQAERDALAKSVQWHSARLNQLQTTQARMRDPERTMVCDILANGTLLDPAGSRYAIPQPAAELAAVTAERDALQAQVDFLQADHAALAARLGVELAGARTRIAELQGRVRELTLYAAGVEAERDELRLSYRSQHNADSRELRRLCAERDAARSMHDAEIAEVERLRAELARYRPDGWRLGLPDGSHPPPALLSDDGRTPAPQLVCVKLYRRDEA